MEVTGKIIVALPEQSGVSQRGNAWKKREYVLETHETYPKKVFFSFFGDRADQYPLNLGDEVTVSFDIDSREYNGRWFVSINAWKSAPAQAPAGAQPQGPAQAMPGGYATAPVAPAPLAGEPAAPAPPVVELGGSDDLPF